jgi:hypothetical protein
MSWPINSWSSASSNSSETLFQLRRDFGGCRGRRTNRRPGINGSKQLRCSSMFAAHRPEIKLACYISTISPQFQ